MPVIYDLTADRRLHLTAAAWNTIRTINHKGNEIVWTEDKTVWGEIERWEFPKDLGDKKVEDCDGITLWKMNQLLKSGFPADPLLFTICYTETGEGHAVLCISTDRGDFVLDNRYQDVLAYEELKEIGYKFLYRSQIGGKLTDLWDKIKETR